MRCLHQTFFLPTMFCRRRCKRLIIFVFFWIVLLSVVQVLLQNIFISTTQEITSKVPRKTKFDDDCLPYSPSWTFSQKRSTKKHGIVIMTAKSPLAFQNVFSAITKNLSVLFIAEEDVFNQEGFALLLENKKPHRNKLKLASIGLCSVDQLTNHIDKLGADILYAIFDESDFSEPVSPRRIGQILACFVSLLEFVAKNRTFKLYLHIHFESSKVRNYTNAGSTLKCIDKLSGPRFQDVMLKSMYLYTTTYQRLYDIPVQIHVS